jgi:hypothetical protein
MLARGGLRADLDRALAAGSLEEKTSVMGTWVGKLAGKAASSASGIGVEVAASSLAKLLGTYLGIS